MFINQLPEECLLIIFYSICELDDLINCFKVCSKWSHLIAERTRKVKYLLEHLYVEEFPNKSVDYVYYGAEEPIDGTCLSSLFPNLIIADLSFVEGKKVYYEDIITLVKRTKLKGLINFFHSQYDDSDISIYKYINELEMVATYYISRCISENGASIKQLILESDPLMSFGFYAHCFPNLERLKVQDYDDYPDESHTYEVYYDGPMLRKLKIVELALHCKRNIIFHGFKFMDSCPNLQSAHINFISYNEQSLRLGDESLEHKSLQDLVLKFRNYRDDIDWDDLKRLFTKYPNLKHLALRGRMSLENEHVDQLVRMLPKLIIFDVRGCPKVTQNAYNYVQDCCELYGRSIKFYFDGNHHNIQSDWPQLSTKCEKISQGFAFMKHCFFKYCVALPTFLIPIED